MKWTFDSGVTTDGVAYKTASYSHDHLEVSFSNGTVHIYDAYSLYNDWFWE